MSTNLEREHEHAFLRLDFLESERKEALVAARELPQVAVEVRIIFWDVTKRDILRRIADIRHHDMQFLQRLPQLVLL